MIPHTGTHAHTHTGLKNSWTWALQGTRLLAAEFCPSRTVGTMMRTKMAPFMQVSTLPERQCCKGGWPECSACSAETRSLLLFLLQSSFFKKNFCTQNRSTSDWPSDNTPKPSPLSCLRPVTLRLLDFFTRVGELLGGAACVKSSDHQGPLFLTSHIPGIGCQLGAI